MTNPLVIEARGVLCPIPIIRLARAARMAGTGQLFELLTDDPAAEYDVPAWCRLRGHTLLVTEPTSSWSSSSPPTDQPNGPEPDAPNHKPGQALRHLIRLGPADP